MFEISNKLKKYNESVPFGLVVSMQGCFLFRSRCDAASFQGDMKYLPAPVGIATAPSDRNLFI